jgi:Na+-translocating ferredoxin:NAD+ oxidoreductase RNF subunit RnfB
MQVTKESEVFDKLSERLGAPGSKYFPVVLAAMMSSDEAQLLLDVPAPMTVEDIAKKLNVDQESLQKKLDDMEQRQIIRKSNMGYATPPNIVAFHHGAIGWLREDLKARVYPLWGDFFYHEWRDILVDGFIERKKTGAPGAHRVVPARKALLASPNIKPEQILWYEDMEQIIRKSESNNLMMCGCRGLWRQCDSPVDVCLHVQYPEEGDRGRNRQTSRLMKPPKEVSYEEALAAMDDCEDRGLVHIPLNTSHGDLFCNCCDDCCMVVNPMLNRGKGVVQEILSPSRFRAVVDQELCDGCQTCVDRCIFDAIEMQRVAGSRKLKSSVIKENCMGCGVCVITCPQKALTMELVRPPEHIPTVSVLELLRTKPLNAPTISGG